MPFDTEVVENNVDGVLIRAEIKYEADADAWLFQLLAILALAVP